MIKEIDLRKLVIEIDDELIKEGKEPFQRPFHAYIKIKKRLQLGSNSIFDDPIFIYIQQIYSELYHKENTYTPPMHMGAFMFKDIFFSTNIPVIYGSPLINSVEFLTDVPEIQKRWIFSEQQSGLTFFDQIIDLMDFVYGFDDVRKEESLPAKTLEYWHLAKLQLEAAAALVLGAFNKYAVIQNCCISAELLLKGALFATVNGITENILASEKKGYGHNLENLVIKTAELLPNLDKETMLFVVKQLPHYVHSRYEDKGFSRLELGNFLMNAQYISGEILRQFSERNFRTEIMSADSNWNLTNRTFPKP